MQTSLNNLHYVFLLTVFESCLWKDKHRNYEQRWCHHTDTDGIVHDEMFFYYESALRPGVAVENIPPQRITVKASECTDELIDPFMMNLCDFSFSHDGIC